MARSLISAGNRLREAIEGWFQAVFSSKYNPANYLGAVILFFMAVVLVSGIYLFIFYETNADRAYGSVESLTHDQWYAGGLMRSLHRYASDGAMLALILHAFRQLFSFRFQRNRWVAWVSGIGLLFVTLIEGISGYWMIWDTRAAWIAIRSVEFLDALPIFGEPLARAFLVNEAVSNQFFFVILFLHLFLPIPFVFAFWIHTTRVSRPIWTMPRNVLYAISLILFVLSAVKPALSEPAANLRMLPGQIGIDWFYLFLYPFFDMVSPAWAWIAFTSALAVSTLVPWLVPAGKRRAARINLRACDGCTQCYLDCPYEAIHVQARSDGRPYAKEAVVVAARCSSCSICVGSCDRAGVELPDFANLAFRRRMRDLLTPDDGTSRPRILAVRCEWTVPMEPEQASPNVRPLTLPCVGFIQPRTIQHAIKLGASGVFVAGCRMGDCHYREGNAWVEQRLAGARRPSLDPDRVDPARVRTAWLAGAQTDALKRELALFEADLKRLPPPSRPGLPGAGTGAATANLQGRPEAQQEIAHV